MKAEDYSKGSASKDQAEEQEYRIEMTEQETEGEAGGTKHYGSLVVP